MKKLTKVILKVFLVLFIVIFVLVAIPLFLLHKATAAPLDQYTSSSETALYTMLDEELSALINDDSEDTVFLTVDEAFINRAIQKELSKENIKFQNSEFVDDTAYNYMMMFSENSGLKGIWTELTDDQIIITAGADYVTSGGSVLYQTGFEVIFDIVLSENNEYYLKLSKIKVGKISIGLSSTYKLADFIVGSLADKSLNDMITESLSFGDFDSEELSFTVGENELTDYLYEVDPTFAALLKVVYKEELLILDVSDEGFDISLNIGVFRRLTTDLDEPAFDKWESESDKADFMEALALQAAYNAFLNPLDPRIDLTEADVNAILDYYLQDKVKFELPIKFMLLGEEVEYIFSSTNLFVTMDEDILSIHLKMSLAKTGMSGSFEMQFNLSSNVSMDAEGNMILTVIEANLGDVVLDNETLSSLFGIFDETLMVDDTLVVKKETLNSMFEGSGVVFNDSYVEDSELKLHFGLDN
jgi:hypothetical protein